jgi:hypothetical protein
MYYTIFNKIVQWIVMFKGLFGGIELVLEVAINGLAVYTGDRANARPDERLSGQAFVNW